MAIFLQRVGEVADGSVTEVKLADGAVTTPKIANEAVSDIKIGAAAITEPKIADLVISTGKIKANAITLAKADKALKTQPFVFDTSLVSVTGTVETDTKILNFTKDASHSANELRVIAGVFTSNVLHTATMKLYVNEDPVAVLTLTSSSLTEELVTGVIDVSALANGKHQLRATLVSANVAGVAKNGLFEIFLVI